MPILVAGARLIPACGAEGLWRDARPGGAQQPERAAPHSIATGPPRRHLGGRGCGDHAHPGARRRRVAHEPRGARHVAVAGLAFGPKALERVANTGQGHGVVGEHVAALGQAQSLNAAPPRGRAVDRQARRGRRSPRRLASGRHGRHPALAIVEGGRHLGIALAIDLTPAAGLQVGHAEPFDGHRASVRQAKGQGVARRSQAPVSAA